MSSSSSSSALFSSSFAPASPIITTISTEESITHEQGSSSSKKQKTLERQKRFQSKLRGIDALEEEVDQLRSNLIAKVCENGSSKFDKHEAEALFRERNRPKRVKIPKDVPSGKERNLAVRRSRMQYQKQLYDWLIQQRTQLKFATDTFKNNDWEHLYEIFLGDDVTAHHEQHAQ